MEIHQTLIERTGRNEIDDFEIGDVLLVLGIFRDHGLYLCKAAISGNEDTADSWFLTTAKQISTLGMQCFDVFDMPWKHLLDSL